MNVVLLSSIITGILAIVAVIITALNQNRINKINQALELKKKHQYYLEPLTRASADLQSRLYNILKLEFIERFYQRGSDRNKKYVISNTAFLFAQFFAWTEAARVGVQFINLDNDQKTRDLSRLQGKIYSIIQSDNITDRFMFFAGEQRAIGERMLIQTADAYTCIGYGEFIKRDLLNTDEFFLELKNEVTNMAMNRDGCKVRLLKLQHALIDLLDYLDPAHVRISTDERSKI